MSSAKHHVFVYGTLMQGERNHSVLNGAKLINGSIRTKEADFFMLQFDSVSNPNSGKISPGVFRKGQGKILGELYEVDTPTFEELDRLEGFGKNYTRQEVTLNDGSKAWMYIKLSHEQSLPYPTHVDFNPKSQCYYWMG